MFKNKLVLVATIIAIVASVFLIIGVGAGVWWLWDKNLPVSVLSVQGESSKKVKYDKVTINLTISLIGKDVSVLNSEIDTKTSKIIDYLKSQNISEDQIQTNKSSYPDYEMGYIYSAPDVSPKERQTRVENNFIVTFTDFGSDNTKPNKVIAEVTKLGVNRFGSFNYDFNDNKKVCSDLENMAIEDAYNKAQDRVKALGGGRIVKKTTNLLSGCGGVNNYPMMYATKADVAASGPSQEIPPSVLGGEQEITSTIELTVEYK